MEAEQRANRLTKLTQLSKLTPWTLVAGAVAAAALAWPRGEPDVARLSREPESEGRGSPAGERADGPGQASPSWLTAPLPPEIARPLRGVNDERSDGYYRFARAVSRTVPIHFAPSPRSHEIGALRLGSLVRARYAEGPGCRGGWMEVEPLGYACIAAGLQVAPEPPQPGPVLLPPDPEAVLPYQYVKVTDKTAFRFGRIPTDAERQAVLDGDEHAATELRAQPLSGAAYFLAVEDVVHGQGRDWVVTLEGNHVRADATEPVAPPRLRGEPLGEGRNLPLAIVVRDGAPVGRGDAAQVASAQRYARVGLASPDPDPSGLVRTKDGHHLSAADVRIARRIARPGDIDADERWVHVDLSQQVLVAYQGDEPVYASLVASGKGNRGTPGGLYRMKFKHLSATMRGVDPEGPWEVQEVPWTMYYDGSYALHGAYWHDTFGAPRSHGCTNIAPVDARWLFHFSDPDVPAGWHQRADLGTHVYITGAGEEPEPPGSG